MHRFLLSGVLAMCVMVQATPIRAEVPGDPADMMGTIPGTSMSRDEFRARAYVQLAAVALNAHAFFAVHNDFPVSYYDLFNSDAWNLDVTNIFSGRAVNAIQFEPKPADMTSAPPLPIPMLDEVTAAAELDPPTIKEMTRGGRGLEQGFELDTSQLTAAAQAQGGGRLQRVNPKAVDHHPAGDIFYYAKSGLLQLVMYAPDGTYVEFVSQVPNRSWIDWLTLKAKGGSFPADLFANEVLFYLDRLLPRHYNMVRFMGNAEPLAEPQLQRSGAIERLKMARELSVTVLNPYNKRPIEANAAPKAGQLVLDNEHPVPVRIALKDGKLSSFEDLTLGPQAGGNERPRQPGKPAGPTKPKKPRTAPPLGGRKG
jgi:hypothetical protein